MILSLVLFSINIYASVGTQEINADVPMLTIVGDKDRMTPKKENPKFCAKDIKRAELLVIDGADSFTLMNKCSVTGLKITSSLCF